MTLSFWERTLARIGAFFGTTCSLKRFCNWTHYKNDNNLEKVEMKRKCSPWRFTMKGRGV